ncbi:hypothetical protein [Pseudobutyrivibrio xylanivorans]|uniref:Uncharacterized protein n=1 Tax=Pseudobutyrivibrio xylanivorans TaxID=185007 RepID=A0A5P6VNL1_PSEXY|nr:hypothetical protein [Pseudobutyrivibrio xylanivorans]QFJ53948.1 hypothetical protein FXF36_03225 [Pseudobutyrivibrio xylanivorans]
MKKNRSWMFIYFAAFIAAVSAIYTIMTYGQTYIHGDSAISIRFLNAVKATGNLYPKSWNGVNGEVYTFNTLPISLLMMTIIKNKPFARALSSAISFVLAGSGMIWLSKKLFKNNSWAFMLPVFCVFISSDNARDMNLYQAAYCPQMVALTFVVGIFLGLWSDELKSKKWWAVHFILLLLMLTGGKRFIAEYFLPMMFVLGMEFILYIISKDKRYTTKDLTHKYGVATAMIIVPFALGFLLNRYINISRNMSANGNSKFTISLNPESIILNIKLTVRNAITIFGYRADGNATFNAMAIIATGLICVVFPLMLLCYFKNMEKFECLYVLFGFLHNAIMLAAVILCSQTSERYVLSVVYVCIVLSGCYLYRVFTKKKIVINIFIVVALFLITMTYSLNLLKVTVGWKDKLNAQESVCQQLLDKGVTKVYATYWPGYPLEIYSDGKLTVAGVSPAKLGLMKYYWHVDEHVFEKKEGKTCLLLTEAEDNGLVLDYYSGDPIDRIIGLPYERFVINDAYLFDNDIDKYYTTNLVVYVFENDDVADTLLDGTHDGVLVPREMDFNDLGVRTPDVIYLTLGAIIHGPYDSLQAGHYTVRINGKNLNVCGTDVSSEQAQGNIAAQVVSESEDCKVIDLIITNTVEDIQFYLTNGTEETAEFYNITIEKQ